MQSNLNKISIIGSGPVGLFCAYFALNAGFEVEIITKPLDLNHNCAGLMAGGMLAPTYELFEEEDNEFVDFAFKSRELWDVVANTLRFEINDLTLAPTKQVGNDERYKELSNFIKSRALCETTLELEIKGEKFAALVLHKDGLINPRLVHEILINYLKGNGVKFLFDEVISYGDRSIKTKTKELIYENLILAAGIGARSFMDTNKELEALVPVRGQIVEIASKSPFDGTVRMGKFYALQRGENTMIGATSVRGDDNWDVRAADSRQLLDAPHDLPEGFAAENIVAAYAGVRPGTKDNYPIIGKSLLENIYLATGTYRNGWLLAPKIGQDLIDLIAKGEDKLPNCFSPARFIK